MSYNLFGHATAEKSPKDEGVENELERELKEELDKLENIFHPGNAFLNLSSNKTTAVSQSPSPITIARTSSPNHIQMHLATPMSHDSASSRGSTPPSKAHSTAMLSVYEIAAMEGEKEQLQDRLRLLLAKLEESDERTNALTRKNRDLRRRNQAMSEENKMLRLQQKEQERVGNQEQDSFSQLEFKLAETRAKLARTQQAFEDLLLSKEDVDRELELERLKLAHVERERDAFSAAYETSLTHFDKWMVVRKNSRSFAATLSSINLLRKKSDSKS
eukprot:gene24323-32760_t